MLSFDEINKYDNQEDSKKYFIHGQLIDFISNLLYKFWLPTYKTVVLGDYIVKGYQYIYKEHLIQCTQTGYIGGQRIQVDQDQYKTINHAKYINVLVYRIGGKYRKFTDNFINNSESYDVKLHDRLGKFVQCYSDIVDTNLKPYFNVNSNKQITNMYIYPLITEDTKQYKYQLVDGFSDKRILIMPIRFNRDYTVAVDCPSQVLIAPVFFSQDRKLLLDNPSDSKHKIDISYEFLSDSNQIYNLVHSSFLNPNVINIQCKDELADKYYRYEDNLYLMVQLPKGNKSTLTVLEGNYKNVQPKLILNSEKISTMNDSQLNRILKSDLSLLQLNTGQSYPFSDRLLEYLFDCVIDYTWKLDGNIDKVQQLLPTARFDDRVFGVWDSLTRYRLYEYHTQSNEIGKLDYCGHLDKDTEKILISSVNNYKGDF